MALLKPAQTPPVCGNSVQSPLFGGDASKLQQQGHVGEDLLSFGLTECYVRRARPRQSSSPRPEMLQSTRAPNLLEDARRCSKALPFSGLCGRGAAAGRSLRGCGAGPGRRCTKIPFDLLHEFSSSDPFNVESSRKHTDRSPFFLGFICPGVLGRGKGPRRVGGGAAVCMLGTAPEAVMQRRPRLLRHESLEAPPCLRPRHEEVLANHPERGDPEKSSCVASNDASLRFARCTEQLANMMQPAA